jgi:hypothetical protein
MLKRTLGERLAISIGTEVPLTVLIDDEKITSTTIYINIRTLFRNFLGSIESKLPAQKDIIEEFTEEVELVISILKNKTKFIPILYLCNYASVGALFSKVMLKTVFTQKQKNETALANAAFAAYLKLYPKGVKIYDCKLIGNNENALLISHYQMDLLHPETFNKLILLESHTGQFKHRKDWITKLTKDPKFTNLPFNIFTLQLFGDENKLLKNPGKKAQDVIFLLAVACYWKKDTTLTKILHDLNKLPDKYWAMVAKNMASIKLK